MAIPVWMPVTAIYDYNDDDDDCDDDDDEDGDDGADKDNDKHWFSLKVPVGWRGIAVSSLSIALCSLSDFSGTTSHHLYK